jgi:hypothetical protein
MKPQPAEIREPLDPKRRGQNLFALSYRLLLGDDIFISYARYDATDYASGLANILGEKGFSCFIDQLGTPPGRELPARLKRMIRMSTAFVLVGTECAAKSDAVRKEVEEFLKTGRPIIPISVGGALEKSDLFPLIQGIAIAQEKIDSLKLGTPSPSVVSRIEKSFVFTRRNRRITRVFIIITLVLLALLGASIYTTAKAVEQQRVALLAKEDARQQQEIADAATAEAKRQQGIAEAAEGKAREQEALADAAKIEAKTATEQEVKQEKIAKEQEKKALENAAEAKRQGEIASAKTKEAKQRELEARFANIDSDLRADKLSPRIPTDQLRLRTLKGVLEIAESRKYHKTDEIRRTITCIPDPLVAHQQVLTPDSSRQGIAINRAGTRLCISYTDRIEVLDAKTFAPINSYKLPAIPPGKIVWMTIDHYKDSLLFEVEYEHFADAETAKNVEKDGATSYSIGGDNIDGQEREIFSLALEGKPSPKSLGLSQKLKWTIGHDEDGDEHGPSWYEIDKAKSQISREKALTSPENRADIIKKKLNLGVKSEVKPIIFDATATSGIYVVKQFDSEIVGSPGAFSIYPVMYEGDGIITKLAEPMPYNEDAKHFFYIDQEGPMFTDRIPEFEPAALSLDNRKAVLGDRLISFPIGGTVQSSPIYLQGDTVKRLSFTTDGSGILVYYKDDSVGLYDIKKQKLLHKFLGANIDRNIAVEPDGNSIILLRTDGSLSAWKISAFQSNGWAAPDCP